MDKNFHKEAAASFVSQGDCYIHTEMKNGRGCQTVMSGDTIAILHGINAEIHRIGELTGTSYDDVMQLLHIEYMEGYGKTSDLAGKREKVIKGSDMEETIRAEERKKNAAGNLILAAEIERLQRELTLTKNNMVDLKKANEKIVKERDRRIQSLTKEINGLNADIARMEKGMIDGKE